MAEIPGALLDSLRESRRIGVLTGAGISAESGVPTFREAQTGLWARFDPLQLATPEAFHADPALVWCWYRWRRELVAAAAPNAAHRALAELAREKTVDLVTQNVDGLHQRAGSRNVIEFHGNLFVDRCVAGDCDTSEADLTAEVPVCPNCGGLLRPGVVWFGEAIPPQALELSARAVMSAELFMSIGTSSQVFPAAGLVAEAKRHGAVTIEINTQATEASELFDFRVVAKAGEALPQLVRALTTEGTES